MNAAVLASGLFKDDAEHARQALHDFWHAIAQSAESYSPFRQIPWLKASSFGLGHASFYLLTDLILCILSPYQFNPNNMNPLREMLEKRVDFSAWRIHCPIHLSLCAINVETGKIGFLHPLSLQTHNLLAK